MKKLVFSFIGLLLFVFLAACGNEEESSREFEHASAEVAFTYYDKLKEGNFEDALDYISPMYLEYIGFTERDFINTFKDRQTLDGWSIGKIDIRSTEEITEDVSVAPQFEPLLGANENYLVMLDLEVELDGETLGVVDHVLVSKDNRDEWKIVGIVSY